MSDSTDEGMTPEADLAEPQSEVTPQADLAEPQHEVTPEADLAEPQPEETPEADLTEPQPQVSPPTPGPSLVVPSPAALARRRPPAAAPTPPAASAPSPSESARFGRVADDGTVYVTDGDTEREVGSYPGAGNDEALQYFARKYDELLGHVDLILQRLNSTDVAAKDAADSLAALSEQLAEPKVVGDLNALAGKVTDVEGLIAQRRETEAQARAQARAEATGIREKLVTEAERIGAQPVDRIQWKQSSERMRELLEEWKQQQRSGPRLERPMENELWHRFSQARNGFDKARRQHFAHLDEAQTEARRAKEALVKEAEQLAKSRDWTPTARAFKNLMDRWRQAGRAQRGDDDALWARFKAAQDSFFAAKDEVAAAEDVQFRANLEVKEKLLTEAQSLLPVTDADAAQAKLRVIQDKWEKAGKVPRGDLDRIEGGLRRIETAVREAKDARWKRANPEVAARANSLVTQLEAKLAGLREDLAAATASGDQRKVTELESSIATQQAWLTSAQAGLDDSR